MSPPSLRAKNANTDRPGPVLSSESTNVPLSPLSAYLLSPTSFPPPPLLSAPTHPPTPLNYPDLSALPHILKGPGRALFSLVGDRPEPLALC